jgi:hypothetical protein
LSAAVGVCLHFEEARESKVANFTGECIFFSLLDEDIFEFEVAMYDFVAVDDLDASKNLIENVECLFEREDFIIEFALDGIEVAHVAILHD